jgi:hypothetical protein
LPLQTQCHKHLQKQMYQNKNAVSSKLHINNHTKVRKFLSWTVILYDFFEKLWFLSAKMKKGAVTCVSVRRFFF